MKSRRKVNNISNLLMMLTTIHHIHGAYVYNTPWRLHVLFLSIPMLALTMVLDRLIKKSNDNVKSLLWMYSVIIFVVSILLIGLFEGVYNHIVKNALFFGGLDDDVLNDIFIAYTRPADFVFEFTGILQGIAAISLMMYYYLFLKDIIKSNEISPR